MGSNKINTAAGFGGPHVEGAGGPDGGVHSAGGEVELVGVPARIVLLVHDAQQCGTVTLRQGAPLLRHRCHYQQLCHWR